MFLQEIHSNIPPSVMRFSEPDIPSVDDKSSMNISSFQVALKVEAKQLKDVAEKASVMTEVKKTSSVPPIKLFRCWMRINYL